MESTVSVVMPCYNGMPYLPEALDSAVGQTVRPLEIIVVDDGSTDASARTVTEFASALPEVSVRLIQQANSGEPAARNRGIREARGEWVAMLDTDDWWELSKLEKQLAAAEAAGPECVMVHTGWYYHPPGQGAVPKDLSGPSRRVGWCTEALLEPTSTGHPSIMVRRSTLEKIGGYNEQFRQSCDIDLYFRLSAEGTFAFVPEHLLHYRIHAKQMSSGQMDQIPFHHRAIRGFFENNPEIREKIGEDRIQRALAEHVACKLESMWWRRQLGDFRKLLAYADKEGIDGDCLKPWRKRARWPAWLVGLKDRLTSKRQSPTVTVEP